MKNIFSKFILCVQICMLSTLVSISVQAENQTQVKVISMNIQCFNDDWRFRLGHILDKFIEFSPEVIGLQEVCVDPQTHENQIDFINNYLVQRGYPVRGIAAQYTHRAWDKYDEYIVLISKLNVSAVDKGLLPVSLLQRGYVALKINDRWFVNTHLEYKAENAHSRKIQIDFIRQRFANQPHLIGGDFNSSPDTAEQAELIANGYLAIFPGDSHLGGDGNASKRIDGFWLSPQFRSNIEYINASVELNQKVQDRYLSDHFAIFANITFKNY
jgi:endonuclease/exonuclease/phosphatase family metal-dependent hydrolase